MCFKSKITIDMLLIRALLRSSALDRCLAMRPPWRAWCGAVRGQVKCQAADPRDPRDLCDPVPAPARVRSKVTSRRSRQLHVSQPPSALDSPPRRRGGTGPASVCLPACVISRLCSPPVCPPVARPLCAHASPVGPACVPRRPCAPPVFREPAKTNSLGRGSRCGGRDRRP